MMAKVNMMQSPLPSSPTCGVTAGLHFFSKARPLPKNFIKKSVWCKTIKNIAKVFLGVPYQSRIKGLHCIFRRQLLYVVSVVGSREVGVGASNGQVGVERLWRDDLLDHRSGGNRPHAQDNQVMRRAGQIHLNPNPLDAMGDALVHNKEIDSASSIAALARPIAWRENLATDFLQPRLHFKLEILG